MLPKGLLKEYSGLFSMLMRGLDLFSVVVLGWLAYWLRFQSIAMPDAYQFVLLIACGVSAMIFSFFDLYKSLPNEGFLRHLSRVMQAVMLTAAILAGLAFFTKSGDVFSRSWFVIWMSLTAIGLMALRCCLLFFLRLMRVRGWNERRVVIFGAGQLGLKFAKTVQQSLWTGFRIITFIDDTKAGQSSEQGIPVIKTPADLSAYLSSQHIDELWLALPLCAEQRIKAILHELRHHRVTLRFVLDILGLDVLNHSVADIAGFPVLNIRSTPMMGMNRVLKAIEDRCVASMILVLVSPLLLFIAAAIKSTSKGPILFKQQRLGWDGRIIKVYKFRTMIEHEDEEGKVAQATINDKRVTRLGRFLRRTSLDELPQFINVLQGRMSIVGPRPHALAHNELYKESIHIYMQRHRVKPGITGWAQINGWRGETDTLEKMQKRVEYDLYYINHWSLGFDLKIILLTLFQGFVNRNAY